MKTEQKQANPKKRCIPGKTRKAPLPLLAAGAATHRRHRHLGQTTFSFYHPASRTAGVIAWDVNDKNVDDIHRLRANIVLLQQPGPH